MIGQRRFRLGVLGSGNGSNFVAVADACAAGRIKAECCLVASDLANAKILETMPTTGSMPTRSVPPGLFRTKLDENAEHQFVDALREAQVD